MRAKAANVRSWRPVAGGLGEACDEQSRVKPREARYPRVGERVPLARFASVRAVGPGGENSSAPGALPLRRSDLTTARFGEGPQESQPMCTWVQPRLDGGAPSGGGSARCSEASDGGWGQLASCIGAVCKSRP